jgi:hypothetical protein
VAKLVNTEGELFGGGPLQGGAHIKCEQDIPLGGFHDMLWPPLVALSQMKQTPLGPSLKASGMLLNRRADLT